MILYEFVDQLRDALATADAETMQRLRSVHPDNLARMQGALDGIAIASAAVEALMKRYTEQ